MDEEPIQRTWKLNLWKRRVFPKGRENKYLRYAKDYLLDFISEPHVREVDYDICENDDISLAEWEKTIGQVANKKIRLKLLPVPRAMSRVNHVSERWGVRSSVCQGLGGILQATITAKPLRQESEIPLEPLCCPVCHGSLGPDLNSLFCEECSAHYPALDNILMLLPQDELRSLYPDAVSMVGHDNH